MTIRAKVTAAAVLLAIPCVLGVSASLAVGSKLVRSVNHPVRLPDGFEAEAVSIPQLGHTIAGWWIDRGPESPVVLLLHPVRANRLAMVSRARLLSSHGFSVLLIDLQGHGETPGEYITFGLRESDDVAAALAWIKGEASSRRVGVVGASLGGASVLLGHQPCGFDAVVLEAVYPRIKDAVENRIRIRFGGLAPIVTPLLLSQLNLRLHVSPDELEPIRSVGEIGAPVLIVAGSLDAHTTLAESQTLFHAAAEPKEIWVLDGAKHQDFLAFDPRGYELKVVGFLDRHLRRALS